MASDMERIVSRLKSLPSVTGVLVACALGINVWVTLLLVPVLHAAGSGTLVTKIPMWALAFPLPLLGIGLFRLNRVLLLALFPISLGVLNAMFRGPTGQGMFTVWTFGLAALSLLGYLVGTTITLEVYARHDDAVAGRRLALPPLSSKWRRRRRVYVLLAAFAALIPLSLIYTIDFFPQTARDLQKEYGAGAAEMQTLLVIGALGLWLWLFHTFFMVPLEQHRRGDADVRTELVALEKSARRAPPPPQLLLGGGRGASNDGAFALDATTVWLNK